jgi:hypothetical protein
MQVGETYVLKDEAETAWEDSYPVVIKLTKRIDGWWKFKTVQMSDKEKEFGHRIYMCLQETKILNYYKKK